MVDGRLRRVFEVFARLLGMGISAVGLLLATSSPIIGIPLIGLGLLLALRPYVAGELVDLAASLV